MAFAALCKQRRAFLYVRPANELTMKVRVGSREEGDVAEVMVANDERECAQPRSFSFSISSTSASCHPAPSSYETLTRGTPSRSFTQVDSSEGTYLETQHP